MKKIALLGSTGSIGRQTLDIVQAYPDHYEIYLLTAHSNVDLLITQARTFRPEVVVTTLEENYDKLCRELQDLPIKIFAGVEALCECLAFQDIDVVVTAMVGFAGLRPTIAAIEAGKNIALANKETLVVAGDIITQLAQKHKTNILPVDSEHSAIFQCLLGEQYNPIHKILLTASGGPFRKKSLAEMQRLTAKDALRHPNWEMGAKITIDSATMMNKGLEMIEAKWLFGVSPQQIEIVVHPESIVHSAVQFADGAVKAQLGKPDMRLPIQYALSFPERKAIANNYMDLFALRELTFEKPNTDHFDCLNIAYEAVEQGGNMPCIMNAANEVVNAAFREGKIAFTDIPILIRRAMGQADFIAQPTLDDYFQTDEQVRVLTQSFIIN